MTSWAGFVSKRVFENLSRENFVLDKRINNIYCCGPEIVHRFYLWCSFFFFFFGISGSECRDMLRA